MRPEDNANRILKTIRALAKMREFRARPEDFIHPEDASKLYSLAVGILGDAAAAIADNFTDPDISIRPQTWSEADGSEDELIRFAATFFDSYLEAELEKELDVEFSLLCAVSYYLSDAVGSATVVAKKSDAPPLTLGGGLARLAHQLLLMDFEPIGDAVHSEFAGALLQQLSSFFSLGASDAGDIATLCEKLRDMVYGYGSARELLYADIVTAICSRKLNNSAREVLPPTSNLPLTAWAPALKKEEFPKELWPSQRRICDSGLLNGKSAVIQMPTSAGKTRATELIIRAAFLSKRTSLAVIVAPYRSLCHDIRGDLNRAFAGESISTDEISDSYLGDFDLGEILSNQSILIVTPEKLLYMLRREPDLSKSIGLVIYDEGHQFEGFARGPTYELLLSSLLTTLSSDAQTVLISAVIANAPVIAEWLIGDASAVVTGEGMLPTAKSIAFASWQDQRGRLEYVNPIDPDDREFFVPRIIGQVTLAAKKREKNKRLFPNKTGASPAPSADIGIYLALRLVPNGSVALFCGTKGSVTTICSRLVDLSDRGHDVSSLAKTANDEQIRKLSALVAANMGKSSVATKATALGALPHHANIPHGIRLCVEYAMKEGHASLVVCTSTLAQGVNFPIKYLIITATQQGQEIIKTRDFHNLMGRAGRSGMHTESSVIFSSPVIYDQKDHNFWRWRWVSAKQLLDAEQAEPTESCILRIFDDYEQTTPPITIPASKISLDLAFADEYDIDAIVASVEKKQQAISHREFSRYIRDRARAVQSIAMFLTQHIDFSADDCLEAVAKLAMRTLAYHLGDNQQRQQLIVLFQDTASAVSENADAEYRALISRSPLPPADLKRISAWLEDNREALQQAADDDELIEFVADEVFDFFSAGVLERAKNAGIVVPLLLEWANGEPFSNMVSLLKNAKIRGANVELAVSICEDGFGYHLAMVLASMVDLVEPVDDELADSLRDVQRRVKTGLASLPAIVFYEAGFADRVVAGALGEAFPEVADRGAVRALCRKSSAEVSKILEKYPDYFTHVALELGR